MYKRTGAPPGGRRIGRQGRVVEGLRIRGQSSYIGSPFPYPVNLTDMTRSLCGAAIEIALPGGSGPACGAWPFLRVSRRRCARVSRPRTHCPARVRGSHDPAPMPRAGRGSHDPASGTVRRGGGSHDPASGTEARRGSHDPASGTVSAGGSHDPASGPDRRSPGPPPDREGRRNRQSTTDPKDDQPRKQRYGTGKNAREREDQMSQR